MADPKKTSNGGKAAAADPAEAARAIDWKKIPWDQLAEVLKLILAGVRKSSAPGAAAQGSGMGGGDPVLQSALRLQLEAAQLLAERIAGE